MSSFPTLKTARLPDGIDLVFQSAVAHELISNVGHPYYVSAIVCLFQSAVAHELISNTSGVMPRAGASKFAQSDEESAFC